MPNGSAAARAVAIACAALLGASAARAEPPPSQPPAAGAARATSSPAPAKQVDINKASRAELKTLPGIGDAEAKKIVAGRPWLTKIDLVGKGVIPEGTYVAIRHRIFASQASATPPKKK